MQGPEIREISPVGTKIN